MSAVAARLADAGLTLPEPVAAVGDYVPAVRVGTLVMTSGQLPMREGALLAVGRLGDDVDEQTGVACARQCALNALAAVSTVCDLDAVVRVVRITGYVASDPDFTAQPRVIDGASAVMAAAYGDAGRHAREAVGVAALPMGAPVELSLVLEIA